MVATDGQPKNSKLECGANYTELGGYDLKVLWGKTVYINL